MRRIACLALVTVTLGTAPAAAQGMSDSLFDTFNIKLEGSWVRSATTIRLDSEGQGKGTTLSFEDDLGLPDKKTVPSLSFEWQFARKHRLGVRWQDINRGSVTQVLEEIEWGGEIIPIDAEVTLDFDIRSLSADYTYYPWIKERWAGGIGLGIRSMGLRTILRADGSELEAEIDGTAPLPYINFEYRRMLGERWRLKAQVGWLEVKISDIKGGQYIGRLAAEYLSTRRWGFGAAINYSAIDVDWESIKGPEEDLLTAIIDLDLDDFSLYLRFRW
ncbi:MAG: hypothetical protein LJE93_00600 [Acidobacteria bacterium]|nr:hypothetical protein [Acidobacteriota bacterium]